MFTLKIKWFRHDFDNQGEVVDKTTLFIAADEVAVHGDVKSLDEMKAWQEGEFQDYKEITSVDGTFYAKLIHVIKNDKSVWYLASNAWLMGPDGKTIERLV